MIVARDEVLFDRRSTTSTDINGDPVSVSASGFPATDTGTFQPRESIIKGTKAGDDVVINAVYYSGTHHEGRAGDYLTFNGVEYTIHDAAVRKMPLSDTIMHTKYRLRIVSTGVPA